MTSGKPLALSGLGEANSQKESANCFPKFKNLGESGGPVYSFLKKFTKGVRGQFFLLRPLSWKDFRVGAGWEKREVLLDFGPRGGGVRVGGGGQLRAAPSRVGTADSPPPPTNRPSTDHSPPAWPRPCCPSTELHARAHFIVFGGGGLGRELLSSLMGAEVC